MVGTRFTPLSHLLTLQRRSAVGAITSRYGSLYRSRTLATLAEDVKSDSTFRIPLIDFGKFRTAGSQAEKRATADEVVNGFKEVGFIYLNVSIAFSSSFERALRK